MVKVSGPMMSMQASGKLGGTVVFATWKGRPYVRALVRPSNPKSGGQVGVRAMFRFLSQNWAALDTADKATWEPLAEQNSYSPFNGYMSRNQNRYRDFLSPTQQDPAAETATPDGIPVIVATAGVRSITVAITPNGTDPNWGLAMFRQITSPVVPTFDNLVGVVLANGASAVNFIDSPLDPNTYYYMARGFTLDGLWTVNSVEDSAVVA